MNYFKLTHPERDDPESHFDGGDKDGWIAFSFTDNVTDGANYHIDDPGAIEFDKAIIKLDGVVYSSVTDEFIKAFADAKMWQKLQA